MNNNPLMVMNITLIITVLLCLHTSIQTNISRNLDIKDNQINTEEYFTPLISSLSLNGYEIILQEDFTDGNLPPVDPVLGTWIHDITADNETWYIDSSDPYIDPYCATVHRMNYEDLQDEWLITPNLDFSEYDVIKLRFHWYTSHLTAVWKDEIDLNVSISLDHGWTWSVIWNEDDLVLPFVSWTWQDSGEIDLSDFAGQPFVRIGFQYYSNDLTDAYAQEFSIDNIDIYGDSELFLCDAGGPYEIAWSWNVLNGVQFHGSVSGGQLPYTNWTWDFGDGNTSNARYIPKWTYNDIGTYNVSLTVIDNARPHHIAFDYTTVKVVETPPSALEIAVKPSMGLVAEIRNTGTLNVSFINWTISIEWGPSKILNREMGNGTISYIEAKSNTTIKSYYNLLWYGFVRVTIKLEPINTPRAELQQMVLIIGPFVFPLASC